MDSNSEHYTIHLRITKKCNADCSYCSSDSANNFDVLSFSELKKIIFFLKRTLFNVLDTRQKHLSVQWVGGEIITYPFKDLSLAKKFIEEELSSLFKSINQGVQTNLIGSPDKIQKIKDLFGGKVGTSIDTFGNLRTVSGSSEKYKKMVAINVEKVFNNKMPPSVFVVDKFGVLTAYKEYERANSLGYDLTLNMVFSGGSSVQKPSLEKSLHLFESILDEWVLKSLIRVEPLYNLITRRVAKLKMDVDYLKGSSSCPFQNNCTEVSLNIDPNGDLYVCYDMADSGHLRLGNGLTEEWNESVFNSLMDRKYKLPEKCVSCLYNIECQGGCMSKSMTVSGSPYGLTEWCDLWMSIFEKIDKIIENESIERVDEWLKKIQ